MAEAPLALPRVRLTRTPTERLLTIIGEHTPLSEGGVCPRCLTAHPCRTFAVATGGRS